MEGLSPSPKLFQELMKAWSGFTLTEGDAEPLMNSRGGQGLVKTRSYVVKTT
ncbi:MAG: hypothetical protein ACP5JF_00560 [Candidatus Methanodesulfokora sp.]|jgi:hypothetical protein